MTGKENIRKILNSRIIKAGSWNMVANFFIKGISYLSIPIFIRMMSIEDYGRYNTFLSYVTIFSCIISFGQNSLQQTAKYDMKGTYNAFLFIGNVLSLITTIIIMSIMDILCNTEILANHFTKNDYLLILICSFFSSVITVYSSKLSVYFQYKRNIIISFFTSVVPVLLAICFIKSNVFLSSYYARIYSLLLMYAGTAVIIIFAIFIMMVKRKEKIDFLGKTKYILVFGSPLVLHLLANSVLAQFDRIMIMDKTGAEKAAIYSFIYTFGIILLTVWTSIEPTWAAWEMQELVKYKYEKLKKYSLVMFCVLSLMACFIILFSPELVHIIGTKKYEDGVSIITPVILSVLLIMLTNFYTQIEYFRRKMLYLSIGTVGAAIINIILNMIFIDLYGYKAAAYTTLISYFFMLLFHVYLGHKLINIKKIYYEKTFALILFIVGMAGVLTNIFQERILCRVIFFFLYIPLIFMILNKKVSQGEE